MEKDILQSIKLEISRSFKLVPYERIALHKVLGIARSENGMRILMEDLERGPLIRESALSVLSGFNSPSVLKAFADLVNTDITSEEKHCVFDHFERFGGDEEIPVIMDFIRKSSVVEGEAPDIGLLARAFSVLRLICGGSREVYDFFKMYALDRSVDVKVRSLAVTGLSAFRDISLFEDLLREGNDDISWSVFNAMSLLCDTLMDEAEAGRTEEEAIFTYAPDREDKVILEVRVLLGKMTAHFEEYGGKIKAAFLNAMLSVNHREFIIYVMKALTSGNPELVERTLYLLRTNVIRLRDPDKLFRNLIGLAMDTDRHNDLVVEIFESYFQGMSDNRKNLLMQDKIYNYMVVTLESFFETYRKEFMVTSVVEKDFPENFQMIRSYVLERLTPEMKNRICFHLEHEDRTDIHKLLNSFAERIPFMDPEDAGVFSNFIEVIYDEDRKSRQLSSVRLSDVNFEKRYLRNRIVRLCRLIGGLGITNAATTLVKIFNYVKKYPDAHIFNATAMALSELNYSYMLGEIELLLSTGGDEEHRMGVRLLSRYTDQRSLNILIDYLRERSGEAGEIIASVLSILDGRDLLANMSANQVLREIIEKNSSPDIRRAAVRCLGRCGMDSDIDFLNSLFHSVTDNPTKEAAVQAIGAIAGMSSGFNRRVLVGYLQEYLKDPGIKVRIFACSLLVSLGNREALRAIRDMMVIKNRGIQREILRALGSQRSVEFSYFLISLLKEEYGITSDIIEMLSILPREELVEIDQFVVNIFKKYDTPGADLLEKKRSAQMAEEEKAVENVTRRQVTLLVVEIVGFAERSQGIGVAELSLLSEKINNTVIAGITEGRGTITAVGYGTVVAFFEDPIHASQSSMLISSMVRRHNMMLPAEKKLELKIQVLTGSQKLFHDELIIIPEEALRRSTALTLTNRIIIDGATWALVSETYYCEPLPDIVFRGQTAVREFRELVSVINFLSSAESLLNTHVKREDEKRKRQVQLDEELKKHRVMQRSPTAVAYAQAIEDVGRKLKEDLNEVNKYLERRVTDRELISTVGKKLNESYRRFMLEISKIVIE